MSQSRFDQLLQKYLAGECTPEEEKIVLEWYEELVRNSELHLPDNEKSVIESRLWEAIQSKTQDQEPDDKSYQSTPPVRSIKRHTGWKIAAAACILALGLAGIFLFRQQQPASSFTAHTPQKEGFKIARNETGIEKKLLLSDSTQITLQPGAMIEYPEQFSDNTREVFLTGNAFFNVHHNPAKHFKVYLGGVLTTEVLGTSFHIVQKNADSSIEVAVVTGKVHVFQQQQENNDPKAGGVVLTRNKKVIYNISTSRFITALVNDPKPFSATNLAVVPDNEGQNRPFIFEDDPLRIVLESLSNAYGIIITTESEKLGLYHFTGNISKYDLYKQLDIICQSTQSVYEIKGDQIIIKEQR